VSSSIAGTSANIAQSNSSFVDGPSNDDVSDDHLVLILVVSAGCVLCVCLMVAVMRRRRAALSPRRKLAIELGVESTRSARHSHSVSRGGSRRRVMRTQSEQRVAGDAASNSDDGSAISALQYQQMRPIRDGAGAVASDGYMRGDLRMVCAESSLNTDQSAQYRGRSLFRADRSGVARDEYVRGTVALDPPALYRGRSALGTFALDPPTLYRGRSALFAGDSYDGWTRGDGYRYGAPSVYADPRAANGGRNYVI